MINKTSNIACAKYEPLLEDYLDRQLSASQLKEVGDHLANCAGCREALAAGEEGALLLRIAEPTPDPGPQFARLVMARIRTDEAARADDRAGFWSPLVSLSWRFAASAAFALILLLTYDVAGNSNSQQITAVNQADVNQAEPVGIFTPEPVVSPATRDDTLMMVAETSYGSD